MRRRGCLFGFTGIIGLLVLCCAVGWFVALPRVQDQVRDDLSEALTTQVANQFEAQLPAGVDLEPGQYTISLSSLEDQVAGQMTDQTFDAFRIYSDGQDLVLSVGSSGQTFEYRGTPGVSADGQLVMDGMSATNDVLGFVLPPDKLGDAVEGAVNRYVGAQGLRLGDVRVEGDQLVFDLAE
jgi:hypothetical protein